MGKGEAEIKCCRRAWRDSNPQPSDPKLVQAQTHRKLDAKEKVLPLDGEGPLSYLYVLACSHYGHKKWAQAMGSKFDLGVTTPARFSPEIFLG